MPIPSLVVALVLLLLPTLSPAAVATDSAVGVNATHIVVGQTAPLSGLQADAGARVVAGMRAAFAEANAAGGVQSRNLTILTLDDGYVTAAAVANYATLQNETLLLANVYGSAINNALIPLVVRDNMPNVGVLTGAQSTRFPFREQMVNFQSSFTDNMVVQAILLVEKLWVQRIACLYQNDDYGQLALAGLAAALTYVGVQLAVAANYPSGSLAIEAALEAIAAQSPPVQAVVLASLEEQSVKFLRLFVQDNRTDPDCVFFIQAAAISSAFPYQVDRRLWPRLYFTNAVPTLDRLDLAVVADFLRAAALYIPPNLVDHISFQTYMIGRLAVQVLRGIPGAITRQSFLDELYNTRLYDVGGLLVGMYSRNFPNCQRVVCGSNVGMRSIFPSTLNLSTGRMQYNASLGHYSFAITELSYPVTNIVRPLLFGQLLPVGDPVWRRVAEAIGQQLQSSLAALNAAGGVDGRPTHLVQQYYAGDATAAAAALASRYALLGFVGSVVNQSSPLQPYAAAHIGTYQTDPLASQAAYNYTEVQVQSSLALELMALAAFACKLDAPVHLRAPATAAGQAALQAMVRSLHSQQQQPASSRTFAGADDALRGLSAGTVIAVGSDADVQTWFLTLAVLPELRLLVPSQRALHLQGSLSVTEYPQASRLHYPSMFSTASLPSVQGLEVTDGVLYGAVLADVWRTILAKSGNSSIPYSTTSQVLGALYGSQFKSNGVTLGPYYSTPCSGDPPPADCECNEGVRQVAVLTAARQQEPIRFVYALSACRVTYVPFVDPPGMGLWYVGAIVGVVVGLALFSLLGWWLVRRGQRDHSAAPKNGAERFCILFTDIESSTHLWATVPDVMSTALHTHHTLIRKLLAKHQLYEVKTIGDSFMCAGRHPSNAVDFALHLQRELFARDWGTDRIDTAYLLQPGAAAGPWGGAGSGWNGLRVRVAVHHGQGEVCLDPVTKGYDYYGTVVNTAARIEAVCHGGQVCVTQAVYDAVNGEFPGAVLTDLGEQVLRGLGEPVHLYQLLPRELSERTFPPLRLEYAGTVEVQRRPVGERSHTSFYLRKAVVPVGDGSGPPSPTAAARTNANAVAHTTPNWVEAHAMVRNGQLTADELSLRYLTVKKALATLLETQSQRVRESSLRAYCERLHVRYFGCDGITLEDTLQGVVQRVLPAALCAPGAAHRNRRAAHPAESNKSMSNSEVPCDVPPSCSMEGPQPRPPEGPLLPPAGFLPLPPVDVPPPPPEPAAFGGLPFPPSPGNPLVPPPSMLRLWPSSSLGPPQQV